MRHHLNQPFPYGFVNPNEVVTPNPLTQLAFVNHLSNQNTVKPTTSITSQPKSQPERIYDECDSTKCQTLSVINSETQSLEKLCRTSGEKEASANAAIEKSGNISSLQKDNSVKKIGFDWFGERPAKSGNTELLQKVQTETKTAKSKMGRPALYDVEQIRKDYAAYVLANPNGSDKDFYLARGIKERSWFGIKKLIRQTQCLVLPASDEPRY